MFWILLIIIVAILILKSILSEDEKKKSPPSPPTDDVYILGCCGTVNCGYWSPEFAKGSDGQIVMNAEKCYCAYKKEWVKEFSQCPFAQEHPDLLIHSTVWDD